MEQEKLEEAVLKARDSPTFFAKLFLNFTPADYQARFLEDHSRRIVLKWSRQSGKSTTLAIKALWFAIFHPNTTTLIVSPSLRQSINLRDIVANLIERMPEDVKRIFVRKLLRTTIYFWRGSRIIALPANPETLRGYTAHLILVDERLLNPFVPNLQGHLVPLNKSVKITEEIEDFIKEGLINESDLEIIFNEGNLSFIGKDIKIGSLNVKKLNLKRMNKTTINK